MPTVNIKDNDSFIRWCYRQIQEVLEEKKTACTRGDLLALMYKVKGKVEVDMAKEFSKGVK